MVGREAFASRNNHDETLCRTARWRIRLGFLEVRPRARGSHRPGPIADALSGYVADGGKRRGSNGSGGGGGSSKPKRRGSNASTGWLDKRTGAALNENSGLRILFDTMVRYSNVACEHISGPSSGFSHFRSSVAVLILFVCNFTAWSFSSPSLFLWQLRAISQNKVNKPLVESSVPGDASILVTGVAGYIGSLTTLQLLEDGYAVVGLDNMSRGSQQALNLLSKYENFHFEHVDLRNKDAVDSVFWKYHISAVLHLAAYSFVLESVDDPTLYKLNNEMATGILVNSMTEHAVSSLVFSSSCAVYGNASVFPITENTPTLPISPYGESKLASEKIILARAAAASKPAFRARILRYFNVVGADSEARLGENPRADSAKYGRLWTSCMNAAFGRASCVSIGRDETYRDFIHVEDVARANIAALQNIVDNVTPDDPSSQHGQQNTWNVAINEATSIKKIVATAESVMGMDIPICSETTKQARASDYLTGTQASIVQGSAELLTSMTGWKPHYTNLKDILTTAWNYSKGRQKDTAVIMFDTRSLEVDSNSSYIYWRWAAELNYRYARRHDYDFIYIHAETIFTPEAVDVRMDGGRRELCTQDESTMLCRHSQQEHYVRKGCFLVQIAWCCFYL